MWLILVTICYLYICTYVHAYNGWGLIKTFYNASYCSMGTIYFKWQVSSCPLLCWVYLHTQQWCALIRIVTVAMSTIWILKPMYCMHWECYVIILSWTIYVHDPSYPSGKSETDVRAYVFVYVIFSTVSLSQECL